ncbi:hypothetical protein B296_00037385 [Ensete ventricosum]|uniref:Uncharacterized protein n=1 Tax=Ensete ventricosum TaxID=4639 RepID=A0A426YNP8_ENSVE|nr:hypothetical protein B296_00037385 [Ensete ventricosum]
MRKRWALTALATCLILVADGICWLGFAGDVERKPGHGAEAVKRPASESAVQVANVGLHRCRSKKIDLPGFLGRAKQNDSRVDDDKRAVPTGPNPLHNR